MPESPLAAASPRDQTDDVIFGEGDLRYRVLPSWAKLPQGWDFHEVAGVGVDASDNVYVFNRGAHPMCVFDREGNFLRAWGEDIFKHAHGIHCAPDGTIYCTDDGDHTVRRMTPEGKVLLELGVPGTAAPFMGGAPFNRCTHTALSPQGDIYVSDGYGNARVHRYAPDGKLLLSWGEPGSGPGQFNLPHNIACDPDGYVYVADRENHRVQVFDGNGRFQTQWNNLHRPSGFCLGGASCPYCFVGEIGPYMRVNRQYPNLGPRVSILDKKGNVVTRLGRRDDACGQEVGQFMSPHGIAVDSRMDIYVGEVAMSSWPSAFPDKPRPATLRTLQKLERLTGGPPPAS